MHVTSVKTVANEPIVEISTGFHIVDADIAAAIVNAFKWDSAIPSEIMIIEIPSFSISIIYFCNDFLCAQ